MAALKTRLMRLERTLDGMQPNTVCPCCQGQEVLAFSDEPNNSGPQLTEEGTCRLCGQLPPRIEIMQLPAEMSEFFTGMPWSDDPVMRFMEKLMLFISMAECDGPAAEQAVGMMYERNVVVSPAANED